MGLIAFICWCKQACNWDTTYGCERMGTMSDGILVLVMRFSKSDAIIGEQPVAILVLFSFSGSDGLEKCGIADKDNFVHDHFWKIGDWRNEQTNFVCLQNKMLMDTNKALRPQPMAQGVKSVVRGNLVAAYADGLTIYIDLAQFFTKFSV